MIQRWLNRCIRRLNKTEPLYGHSQSLFSIVQRCTYKDLHCEAAEFVANKGTNGNTIGGSTVSESTEVMYEVTEVANGIPPRDKPRCLMGVGTPQNILEAIERGVDMLDYITPTHNGRNVMPFTYSGMMNMKNKKWGNDFSSIDSDGCDIGIIISGAYLHHLFKAGEPLAMQIASIHNLALCLRLVTGAHTHIRQGDFVRQEASVIEQLGRRV